MGLFPKWLTKATKKATKTAKKYVPVVKVFQAGHGILKVGQMVNKCIDVGDTINETIPAMRVMVGSFCDKITFISSFVGLAHVAGIAANIIQTYQGIDALREIGARLGDISNTLEAQTALQARMMFADLVYDELWDRLMSTTGDEKFNHWYFVYHPDTIWYSHFNRRIWEKPLSKRFCGYTNCLDMAVIFMLAIRKRLEREQRSVQRHRQPTRTIKLHLLIPAYRVLFIPEFVEFPEDLSCFVVEGAIHNSKHLVWLNIPEEQNRFLSRIKNWKPPEATFYQKIGAPLGLATLPPRNSKSRVLGTRLEDDEDEDNSSIASSTLRASSEDDSDNAPSDDDFSDNDNENHDGRRSSSTNHSAESPRHNRRENRENRSRTHSKRRRYKPREMRNTHNPSRSSRRQQGSNSSHRTHSSGASRYRRN
ncbi:hypothetical protein BDZ45DRAFT_682495 [Acephala macrosclerotiorum]|nr:hypothetical protein BDZ45DRAFT_682495 [Acephala macrosclerotiorum]